MLISIDDPRLSSQRQFFTRVPQMLCWCLRSGKHSKSSWKLLRNNVVASQNMLSRVFRVFAMLWYHFVDVYFCVCTAQHCAVCMWLHVRRRPLQLIYYADCNGVDCTAALTKAHISNVQVIKSKNEQNCSLIHMMKYNPLDGNCICFVLTFLCTTHMHAYTGCLNRISRMLFSFSFSVFGCMCIHMYWTCWVDGNDGYVIISQQLHLMFGFHVSTSAAAAAAAIATQVTTHNFFNQII